VKRRGFLQFVTGLFSSIPFIGLPATTKAAQGSILAARIEPIRWRLSAKKTVDANGKKVIHWTADADYPAKLTNDQISRIGENLDVPLQKGYRRIYTLCGQNIYGKNLAFLITDREI